RISLLRWFSERWAFPVSFFPTGSTAGRKQAIVRSREIQIVRRDGGNDKKTKEQKSKRQKGQKDKKGKRIKRQKEEPV
ncbi:hypothetical protein, partial [uncultured Bacteroides sp.]|uniref:hypothetical protein n=1 Tax=uncultured Bacteroides sp. TaxID=162156 RepID=UPI0026108B30